MRVTTKGQVTIPQHIRKKLGITPATEVDFVEDKGRIILESALNKGVSQLQKGQGNQEITSARFLYWGTSCCP
jgi:AbrB family looped-hinge helix DNA binding protein